MGEGASQVDQPRASHQLNPALQTGYKKQRTKVKKITLRGVCRSSQQVLVSFLLTYCYPSSKRTDAIDKRNCILCESTLIKNSMRKRYKKI